MPFCPKCKNEYREGFTVCAECKCELVDSLTLTKEEPLENEAARECELLKEKLPQGSLEGEVTSELVSDADISQSVSEQNGLKQEEASLEKEETEASEASAGRSETGTRPKDGYKSGIYRNNAERAEDNKSSAWTLLSVGILGIVLLVLVMTGVIPLYFYGVTKFMAYGVMFALFILFIVMGMVSLRNSRIFAKKAESDSTLSDTMHDWCRGNLDASALDAQLFDEEENELAEEMKYFKRTEYLKRLLSDKFMNLDEGFLEDFVDHIYSEIFEE